MDNKSLEIQRSEYFKNDFRKSFSDIINLELINSVIDFGYIEPICIEDFLSVTKEYNYKILYGIQQ